MTKPEPIEQQSDDEPLTRKRYEKQLKKLQVELCCLQDWATETGARVIVLLEGRDAAGKGGLIKAISERVSPRVFRAVALPSPSVREKTQMFIQRYSLLPARLLSLTAVGITGLVSNTSWVSVPMLSMRDSWRSVHRWNNGSSSQASYS